MQDDDPLVVDDDESHPIPFPGTLDMIGSRSEGGVDLIVVLATRLEADERSLRRLVCKIAGYLGFVNSEDFREEFGDPRLNDVRIVVNFREDPAPEVLELLGRLIEWAAEGNAQLVVGNE